MADKAGGVLARVGTPAGASVAADIAATKAVTDTIDGNVDQSLSTTESNLMGASGTHKDIIDAIATLSSGLTAKQASLLGVGVCPGFSDYFNTVANDADPDVTFWTVLETGGGICNVETDSADVPGRLNCNSGAGAGDDAGAFTKDKRVFSLKNGVTTIHLKAYVNLDWGANSQNGIGFIENDVTPANMNELHAVISHKASILANGGTPTAHSDDGAVDEATDLSAFISDNTWFLLEIVISATDVKFYIDDTLRATHNTRVPDSVWQILCGVTDTTATGNSYFEYVQVWGE